LSLKCCYFWFLGEKTCDWYFLRVGDGGGGSRAARIFRWIFVSP
jgi:hypothetical protein